MPHGPINILGGIPGTYRNLVSNNGGASWTDNGNVNNGSWRVVRYQRPASTSNPIRADGTRRPNNWLAVGGSCSAGVNVSATVKLSGNFLSRHSGTYNPYWCKSGVIGNPPAISSTLKADVMRGCLAGYTKRSVQLNTAMRQTRDTLRMVGDASTSMARGLNRVMQGLPPGSPKSWTKLPARYLEYLYGWKPISDDVSLAFTELAELQNKGYARKLEMVASRSLKSRQRVVNNGLGSTHMAVDYADLKQVEKCGLTFKLPDWFDELLPVVSPFGNLWEQTPFSFVVDWFLPIGDWVGAMESMQLSPFFTEGWQSSKYSRKFRPSEFSQADNTWAFVQQSPIPVRGSDYWSSRSVVTSIWDVIKFPDLRSPMSLDHAAQGSALLTQVFKKWGFT